MQVRLATSVAFAVALSIAPFSGFSQFASGQQPDAANSQMADAPPAGLQRAIRMAPGRATLQATMNAKQIQIGQTFVAKLRDKVQLDHGPELPPGTILTGTVQNDDMQEGGTSKLALRFETATLKDGTVIPIKATIVGVYGPKSSSNTYPVRPGDEVPNNWNDGTLVVDQIGVTPGVDLHSKIASRNSGVFVSTKKDDVTLRSGSELQLAIGAGRPHHHDQGDGGSGSGAGASQQ